MRSLKESAGPSVRVETLTGPEWTEGGVTVTPVARSLRVGRAAQGDGERCVPGHPRCS